MTRGAATLDRLAEMTKGKDESRTGSGAAARNAKNFVFATVSPDKKGEAASDAAGEENKSTKNKRKRKAVEVAVAKKQKVDRMIDENSMDTIFGHL